MTTFIQTGRASESAWSQPLIIGGLLSGLALGMWTMTYEAIIHAGENLIAAFFSPVVYIAATILGGFANPDIFPAGTLPPPDPVAIVVGLMGHMMNSVILGVIFFWLVGRVAQTNTARIIAGLVFGVAIFAAMWYLVLPIVDPVMLRVDYVGFLLGHMMYGIGLGLVANWAQRGQVRQA